MAWLHAETAAGTVAVDPALGNIRALAFRAGGGWHTPLHTAAWVEDPEILGDDRLLPVERQLAGDFFCAPFGASDDDDVPAHGWPANSAWTQQPTPPGALAFVLDRPVQGAKITKRLTLAADAPLLYQEHLIADGAGGLTVAHHPMIRLAGRGRLSTSAKRQAISPDTPLDAGRNRLACPAARDDLTAFPADGGGVVDLTDLPIANRHEDFVTLIEAEGSALGWTAVLREAEGDVIFFLKDPAVLPVTMLWHSNGGRDYAPWNGRHTGVLGIEDGCAAGAAGLRAALGPNPIAALGVPTHLALGPTHRIAHVIGALPRPDAWTRVADMAMTASTLTLTGDTGTTISLPFDADFFTRSV